MVTANRYEIGFGPLKGPDLGLGGNNGVVRAADTFCSYFAGIPEITGRSPGDQHVDSLTGYEYVLAGKLGANYTDTFDRPDSSYINTGNAMGWTQYPAGETTAWSITGNALRGFGASKLLSRVYTGGAEITVTATTTGISLGTALLFARGNQDGTKGYSATVTLDSTASNVAILRDKQVVASGSFPALVGAGHVLSFRSLSTGVHQLLVDGVVALDYADVGTVLTGTYYGVGTGPQTSNDLYYDTVTIGEPNSALYWLELSAGGGTAPPATQCTAWFEARSFFAGYTAPNKQFVFTAPNFGNVPNFNTADGARFTSKGTWTNDVTWDVTGRTFVVNVAGNYSFSAQLELSGALDGERFVLQSYVYDTPNRAVFSEFIGRAEGGPVSLPLEIPYTWLNAGQKVDFYVQNEGMNAAHGSTAFVNWVTLWLRVNRDTGGGGGGTAGPAGPAGPTGPSGPSGPAGPTGPTGATGTTGATGATGPQGVKGDTGDPGPTGATGATGPAGADGTGTTPGPVPWTPPSVWDNVTAYVVGPPASLVTYSGESYVAILDGTNNQPDISPTYWRKIVEKGATGSTGAAGAAGADGAPGPAGADGATGPQGPPGADGAPGMDGATGATGAAGPTGATGPQGPAGTGTGTATDRSALPYYIAAGETFTVPLYQVCVQAAFCDNEGLIVIDGMLVEVD